MYYLCILLVLVASATAFNVQPRIIGGQPTILGEHPYQVSLQIPIYEHFCGGSLVKPNRVLTAAHCFSQLSSRSSVIVQAGSIDRLLDGAFLAVESFKTHPSFSINTLDNDIAVVALSRPFLLGRTISPISLVEIGKKPQPGAIVTVTGWGCVQYAVGTEDCELARFLHGIKLSVISDGACLSAYAKSPGLSLSERTFCTQGTMGPFQGDSGGPAVSKDGRLAGVVSWRDTTEFGVVRPAVFTDLSNTAIRRFVDSNL